MFGEGMEEDPEFANVPPERSLEGIKKWKKAIILWTSFGHPLL